MGLHDSVGFFHAVAHILLIFEERFCQTIQRFLCAILELLYETYANNKDTVQPAHLISVQYLSHVMRKPVYAICE